MEFIIALCGPLLAGVIAWFNSRINRRMDAQQEQLKEECRRLAEQKQREDAVGFGVQALLRDRIIQAYNHYTEKGYCPIYGLENVEEMYRQYHALGGNGTITELVERVKELPTQPKGDKII